jgi:hypothetical protein
MTKYAIMMYHTFVFDLDGDYNEDDAIQHCINIAEEQGDFIYTASFEVAEAGLEKEDDE